MHVTAVIVAAGSGSRLKTRRNKALIRINKKPLAVYCLEAFNDHAGITDLVLVVNPRNRAGLLKAAGNYGISKIAAVVLGGERRQDSVYNGLRAVSPKTDIVLIHDGGRPFVEKELISDVIRAAAISGAAIAAVPVKSTIKEASDKALVKRTLDRKRLWEIQTPQGFKKELILKAYRRHGSNEVTDDAALVEKLGKKVALVPSRYSNIKVTTPEDLVIAEAIAKNV